MGFMDHLLATLSPERAVKTAAARMAIQTLNSGYGNYGANLHKKSMRGWMWHGGDSKGTSKIISESCEKEAATLTWAFRLQREPSKRCEPT